jgi:hypothetical protein
MDWEDADSYVLIVFCVTNATDRVSLNEPTPYPSVSCQNNIIDAENRHSLGTFY